MNASKTNEQALESSIEKRLSGYTLEELKDKPGAFSERQDMYRAGNGYYIGLPNDFNPKYAIDEHRFWNFLQETQKTN